MKLDDLVAVSGLPGIYKVNTSRQNGLVVDDLDSGKSKFCSVRKHQFTPLGTVAIYTFDDTVELKDVFRTMTDMKDADPIVSHNDSADTIQSYFEKIIPEYDRDRVYVSDMKKVLKWYSFLEKRELIGSLLSEEE